MEGRVVVLLSNFYLILKPRMRMKLALPFAILLICTLAFWPYIYLFFALFISPIISFFSSFLGYELACYDLHGRNRCKFEPTIKSRNLSTKPSFTVCKEDKDCLSTKEGNCFPKQFKDLKGVYDGKCACLKEPGIQGCFPSDSELQFLTPDYITPQSSLKDD